MTGPVSQYQNDNRELLSALGLLPPDGALDSLRTPAFNELARAGAGAAIERSLLEFWTEWRRAAPRRQRDRATKVAAWLKGVVESGGSFTLRIPDEAGRRFSSLCGKRVFFWPHGRPPNSLAVITSSRIGRSNAVVAAFVEKLRFLLPRVAEAGQTLLIVEETAGAELVHRAARQADISVLLATATADRHPEQWLFRLMETDLSASLSETRVCVSPSVPTPAEPIDSSASSSDERSPVEALPLRDRLAVALAETVWNLSVRKGGNLHRLLNWRLEHDREDAASVRLVVSEDEPVPDHVAALVDRGAIPWQLLKRADSHRETPQTEALATGEEAQPSVVVTERSNDLARNDLLEQLSADGDWLIHWTRALTRPLGEPHSDEWLDRHLQSSPDEPTGALATLQQILRDGIIRASADGLRGSKPMTCFSAVPLRELVSRRRFQTHRARWDFEPYGLCIRRRALEALGARPVIYGDDSLWQALPEPERPWFQQRFSGRGKRKIDWSEELEWRVAGDVVLGQFGRDDLVVFCRDASEVKRLEDVSAWPVIKILGIFDS